MNKDWRYDFPIEMVRTLRTGYDGTKRNGLVMPEEILDKKRLTRFALADQHDDLIVFDLAHVEFLESQIQATCGGAGAS